MLANIGYGLGNASQQGMIPVSRLAISSISDPAVVVKYGLISQCLIAVQVLAVPLSTVLMSGGKEGFKAVAVELLSRKANIFVAMSVIFSSVGVYCALAVFGLIDFDKLSLIALLVISFCLAVGNLQSILFVQFSMAGRLLFGNVFALLMLIAPFCYFQLDIYSSLFVVSIAYIVRVFMHAIFLVSRDAKSAPKIG